MSRYKTLRMWSVLGYQVTGSHRPPPGRSRGEPISGLVGLVTYSTVVTGSWCQVSQPDCWSVPSSPLP
jgi:hypothetical protein